VNTSSIIQSDALFTRDIKSKADQAVQDTIVATRIVDGFRNPQQNGAYLKNHATLPLESVLHSESNEGITEYIVLGN
jgi:nucleoporin p58/p45